jgi:glycosyltransferase involved in cell wall biosynthesis
MVDLPKITVVTPSYNQGEYLERTILSVLTQGYPNLEYIVLDGGSNDESPRIIEKYSRWLAYWHSGPDGGQASAIAEGFRRATGEVLCWINSDDMLLPGSLEYVGRLFGRRGRRLQWLIGGTVYVDPQDRILLYRRPLPQSFRGMISVDCTFSQASSFWRRSLYEEVGGFDISLRFCFDYDMFTRFCRQQRPGWTLRMLSAFRLHPESKTSMLEEVRLRERQGINEKWNVRIPGYGRRLHWLCKALWGKFTTTFPHDGRVLEAPSWID